MDEERDHASDRDASSETRPAPVKSGRRSCIAIVVLLALNIGMAAGVAIWFFTGLERNLGVYARAAAGKEAEWFGLVRDVPEEELDVHLYAFDRNTAIRPVRPPSPFLRVLEEDTVWAFRCRGTLVIVLDKWVNFSAGICIRVEGPGPEWPSGVSLEDIRGSEWKLWRYDGELPQ